MNTTPTVQVAPTSSDEGQVFVVVSNPFETASPSADKGTEPVLVSVTVCGEVTAPTPVVAKVSTAGCN